MSTRENCPLYDRDHLRYPSDVTDNEWWIIASMIPPGKPGGRQRAPLYVLSTGCQWRAIPKDLPPHSTVYDYFGLWGWAGGKSDRRNHRQPEHQPMKASPINSVSSSLHQAAAVENCPTNSG